MKIGIMWTNKGKNSVGSTTGPSHLPEMRNGGGNGAIPTAVVFELIFKNFHFAHTEIGHFYTNVRIVLLKTMGELIAPG